MKKGGKGPVKPVKKPAAKPKHKPKPAVKKAHKTVRHESAAKRKAAALKAAKTRAAHKKAAKAAALDPGGLFDGCVITAVQTRLTLAGVPARYGDLIAAFRAAGGRPDGGVPIEAMLGALGEAGVIRGYRAVDVDPDALDEPGLILGADLPGSHAVVTVPACPALRLRIPLLSSVARHSARPLDGQAGAEPAHWLSWGTTWDPAAEFPDATVTEAWRLW